ncbi:hypothetical protein DCCM_0180 [Desulfocucumis palustris]|uniref:YlqD protein n=1 Tax=Desulfocucumis palustris TaxID=1898651 RepID=A0A2L2X736_9FIRM|nr:YlqD family protein [Desulfocucumis palustris]GBF31989.1 hypothetical protein DCCM_0180 [Desulfocucumis palustris]
MGGITITRPVIVKIKVTEEYKKNVAGEIQEAISRVDMQIRHIEFQARRLLAELEKKNPQGITAAKQHLEKERSAKLEARQRLLDKLKQTANMSIGEEIVHGQVESIVELKVGDHWSSLFNVEVVIEDGRVIEIRQGGGGYEGG